MKAEIFLSRQWWKTTLLVLAAVVVMVRLGIWQLDRLAQRKEFNSRVELQLALPPLDLMHADPDLDLVNMEYRELLVSGTYDYQQQIVLRNQEWQGNLGVHLLTPLIIEGREQAILVDRGWVPYEDFTNGDLEKYDHPGLVSVEGAIRRSQVKPKIGGQVDQVPEPGEPALEAWYWINLNQIDRQMTYELLPIYLQEGLGSSPDQLPYRAALDLDLSEGPHLGYAIQWFIFATILAFGYPIFVKREETRIDSPQSVRDAYIKKENSGDFSKDVERRI